MTPTNLEPGSKQAPQAAAGPPAAPRLPFGLCAYGLLYTCGFAGRGTPLANPRPLDMFGLADLAAGLGLDTLEIPPHELPPDRLAEFRRHAAGRGLRLVVAGRRLSYETLAEELEAAAVLGATVVRCTLSGILCGDRSPLGLSGWRELLGRAAEILRRLAPRAADLGLRIGVENHQDATSADLIWLCEQVAHPAVGVTLDTGNPLAVCEDPVEFARRVLPFLVNVHLKDYWIVGSAEGCRLVHCPIGAGAVDFAGLFDLLADRPEVPRSIELAALGERHVRWLTDDWWAGHEPRAAADLLPFLRTYRRHEAPREWRTPFETGEVAGLVAWERARLEESVRRLTTLLRR